jgi:hypothetical protein
MIANVPDMEAFQKAMQSDEAAEAMRFDGVRPETLVILGRASDHLLRCATGYAAVGASPGAVSPNSTWRRAHRGHMSAECRVKQRELTRAEKPGHGRFESQTAAWDDQRMRFVNNR